MWQYSAPAVAAAASNFARSGWFGRSGGMITSWPEAGCVRAIEAASIPRALSASQKLLPAADERHDLVDVKIQDSGLPDARQRRLARPSTFRFQAGRSDGSTAAPERLYKPGQRIGERFRHRLEFTVPHARLQRAARQMSAISRQPQPAGSLTQMSCRFHRCGA